MGLFRHISTHLLLILHADMDWLTSCQFKRLRQLVTTTSQHESTNRKQWCFAAIDQSRRSTTVCSWSCARQKLSNNPSSSELSTQSGERKRNSEDLQSFSEADESSKQYCVKFVCCPNMRSVPCNSLRAMKHLLNCQSFKYKFPADYESLV